MIEVRLRKSQTFIEHEGGVEEENPEEEEEEKGEDLHAAKSLSKFESKLINGM